MPETQARSRKKNIVPAIILTGLIAGLADGTAAIIQFYLTTGRGPAPIFKYIASAVFGPDAYSGGNQMMLAGIGFHLLIAMGWTILFFLLYRYVSILRGNIIVSALLYGFFVWLMMTRVLLPVTRIPAAPFHWDKALIAALILVVCIGIPANIGARNYYRQR